MLNSCIALARLLPALALAACHVNEGSFDGGAEPDMRPPTAATLLASRPYTATVPAAYDAGKSWPLLLVLAGYAGAGADTSAYLGLTQLAADRGIFLVTPNGLPVDGVTTYAWNPDPVHGPQFDVEYLTAIIHDLESKYSIDPKRVFIAGHSLGAHMAHRMACDDSADVVAIMSLAGEVTKVPSQCAPKQTVSVLDIHGTADRVIGYNGDVQNSPPDPSVPSAHETLAVWARNDSCTGPIVATGVSLDLDSSLPGNETTVEAYSGCPSGIGVELWTIAQGMHDPTLTPDFANLVWTFLTGHARP